MTRIITVTSGKGGVGKTNLTANLAVQLASEGYRVCIFDADLGLANINILFGLYPEKTIQDVLTSDTPLQDIAIKNQHGIDIIPGSSGVESIANAAPQQIDHLIASFTEFPAYDFLFFDTSAGVSRAVVSFCLAASETILLITPEPTSLTDAYALLKILSANGLKHPIRIIVNHCKDAAVARQTYARFRDVVKKYLPVELHPLGFIIEDPKVSFAVKRQQPFVKLFPATLASKCIKAIAHNLLQQQTDAFAAVPVSSFWKQFVGLFSSRLALVGDQEVKGKAPEEHPPAPQPPEERKTAAPPAEVPIPAETVSEPQKETAIPPPALPLQGVADQTIQSLLQTLASGIAAIAEECKLLRKAIENSNHPASSPPHVSKGSDISHDTGVTPIILDFESYVQQHAEKQS
ncbi:MAG: P-loop NTPase [Desulfobacterota bacterium]|nr:P-loop NTPase [Thermodesulfobacteriota bacterium]